MDCNLKIYNINYINRAFSYMVDLYNYDKLVTLNNVYKNTLIQCNDNDKVSELIKTKLFPHQLKLVQNMDRYRERMTHGFIHEMKAIHSKIGIICDPSGTGKTLSILSYLASTINYHFPMITNNLSENSSKYFFSHDLHHFSDASSSNLIIVPHHLFGQWKDEIESHTTLKYLPIETKRVIKETDTAQKIIKSHIVLTTNTCYKYVEEYAVKNNIQWKNVIIDEASSIYLQSSDPSLRFEFLWLVTQNWLPLLFKHSNMDIVQMSRFKTSIELHPECEKWLNNHLTVSYDQTCNVSPFLKEYLPYFHPQRWYMFLRNSSIDIEQSISLYSPIEHIIQCRPNVTINSLSSIYLARNAEPIIKSSQIPQLYQALGVEFKSISKYIEEQPITKSQLIQRKVNEKECSICLDKPEYTTIVNCCYNIYCGKCLLRNTLIYHRCPTCREGVNITNMCCLDPLLDSQKISNKNKMEMCLDLLRENKNGKFIIHSTFNNIYYQLFEEIDKLGLKAERIENNLFSLLKTIKNFKEGSTQILFVSNIDAIRGLSLSSISHLIFYHEQPSYEWRQLLIHSAQRMQRMQPLKILHLHSEIQV